MKRTEQEVFLALEALCLSLGYAHALAYICFRDNFIKVGDKLEAKDLASMSSDERLCRTETSVLIGLMVKGKSYLDMVEPKNLSDMVERSDKLLAELHETMNQAFQPIFMEAIKEGSITNPFKSGIAQRESIFYSAESAYEFQFKDFAQDKYRDDNDWFITNKGYSIKDAVQVLGAISVFQSRHLIKSLDDMQLTPMDKWTILPGFMCKHPPNTVLTAALAF